MRHVPRHDLPPGACRRGARPLPSGRLAATLLAGLALGACGGGDDAPARGSTGSDADGGAGGVVDGGPGGPGPTDGANAAALGPLPSPPLTEPPSADDEPVPEGAAFSTARTFAPVRDRRAFPADELAPTLTEADFAAGLPAPEIERPVGLDADDNAAPAFEGLANVRVTAGETLSLRFAPTDPDGGLPGMFPQRLPEGATFEDNFDGTKTLLWQPLQADLGVTAFTAVAIDPEDGRLRTSQTVLIAVDAPADPASIPNVAPGFPEIPGYVVRAGDPVVVEVEGIDRNGTVPTLELPAPPPGATLLPRPFEPERYALGFVPEAVGETAVEVVARDAVDASLTGSTEIVLDVRAPAAFALPGERLGTLGAARGIEVGSAISPFFHRQADGALYESIAAEEFRIVTPESSMKMDAINPLPGHFAFAETDNLVAFARAHAMSVRGHPLVWYRQLPDWVLATPVAEREGHMREFIARVVGRYAEDVAHWDVVNEPLADDGSLRESIWSEAMGESYIDVAFRQARALDPDATLVLNEFDIAFEGPKFDALLELVDRLLERGVPIDAVGFQLHLFASYDEFDELAAHMAAVAARGLDVHVTELDVALTDATDESDQAGVYGRVVETCLAEPRCTVLQTWGFTDRYSFRTFDDPLPLDRAYRPKPAYGALQEALGN